MKKYVHIALIIGVLLHIVEMHATVLATAVLRRGNNTIYLLSDMPDESLVAVEQREAVLKQAREGILVAADDCDDLQAVISAFSSNEGVVSKKLTAEQVRVSKNVERVKSLLPSLVTLGREQKLPIVNMHYESTMRREDISLSELLVLLADLNKLVENQGNYLLPADKDILLKCYSAVNAITEQTKGLAEMKEALHVYATYSKYLLVFETAEILKGAASLIVCAAPENVAFIADRLAKGGWEGDASQVERLAYELMSMRCAWIEARKEAAVKVQTESSKKTQLQRSKKARSSAQAKLKKNFDKEWEKTPAQLRKQELAVMTKEKRYAPVDLTAFFQGISALKSLVSESSSAAQSSVPVEVKPKEDEQELLEPKSWITTVLGEPDDNSDVSPDDLAGKTQVEPSLAAQSVPVPEMSGNIVVPTIDADNLTEVDEAEANVQQKPTSENEGNELELVHVPSGDGSEDNNEPTVKPSWFSANKVFVGCGVTAAVVAGCVLAYKNGLFDGFCKKLNSFGWF